MCDAERGNLTSAMTQAAQVPLEHRLRDVPRESKAIEEAFAAVRSVASKRGLKKFAVEDAVLVFISLTFFPLAQRSTFMTALGKDLGEAKARRRHVRLVTAQLLHLIGVN